MHFDTLEPRFVSVMLTHRPDYSAWNPWNAILAGIAAGDAPCPGGIAPVSFAGSVAPLSSVKKLADSIGFQNNRGCIPFTRCVFKFRDTSREELFLHSY